MSERRSGHFILLPELSGHWHADLVNGDVCVFDAWLGDDVVRAHPQLLVTTPVKEEVDRLLPSGLALGPVRCETSAFFRRHSPGRQLPDFWLVRVDGEAGVHDVGLARDGSIVISQRVLDLLMGFRIRQAVLAQYAVASEEGDEVLRPTVTGGAR